jgi:hypothetical protein
MTSLDLDLSLHRVPAATTTTTTTTSPSTAGRVPRPVIDFAVVVSAWALVVVAALAFPLDDPQVSRIALFIHLISMAIGFGAVVMVDVYGIMWLFGFRSLGDIVALATCAHTVVALGVGGLLASGIALRPELDSTLAQFKMVLVLVLMLNGVAAQRTLQRMRKTLPPDTRGASIPWSSFQRVLAAALISQSTWWGSIAIGFVTNANRHT